MRRPLRAFVRSAVTSAALTAACSFGVASCTPSTSSSKQTAPKQTPAPTQAAKPQEPKAASNDEYAQEVVSQALEYVSRLRSLPPKTAVRGRVISRADMVTFVQRELDEEIPPDVVAASTEILYALNTVPAGFDYRQSILDLMKAQLAGFYVPREKTMFLGGDLGGTELQVTLWHELVHALQDQHYNLDKVLDWVPDASDRQSALHALAEGDATSAMIDAMYSERGIKAPDIPDSLMDIQGALSLDASTQVPSIIKRSLIAAYFDGLSFVNALRRQGSWAAVDAAWRKPPVSTEQLLHVDKFIRQEAPEPVPLPVAAANGPQKLVLHDIYGEQTLRLLFEEWMPTRTARESAADWAGDRIAVFRDGNRISVAWRIRFDTDSAARRALTALARGALYPEDPKPGANGRLPDAIPAAVAEQKIKAGQLCQERHSRGPMALALRGREVTVTLGPYQRDNASSKSASNCREALAWAAQILRAP